MGKENKKFMQRAIDLAANAIRTGTGGPFGAVIVRNGKIIGEGQNRVLSQSDPTAHAEVIAIRDACEHIAHFELRGCQLYTSCEPCPMCLGAVLWSRLECIYYAANQDDAAAVGFDDHNFYTELNKKKAARSIPMHETQRQDAVKILNEWLALENKQTY